MISRQSGTYGTYTHLVAVVYDGDGNRVSETIAGVTTQYLVDTQNPTGYAQVVDEIQNGSVVKSYSYGLERISQRPTTNGQGLSFYGYDGHGSVRFLTDSTGAVSDTYDFDAFGNLISSTGTTPNNYLFAGEQHDPALNLYYDRARYLNTTTGRFWSMDTFDGDSNAPASLHKYLYASDDPIGRIDPSGHDDIAEVTAAESIDETLEAEAAEQPSSFLRRAFRNKTEDVYMGVYPTKSFPFVHSYIYVNNRETNAGVKWDVGFWEDEDAFLPQVLFTTEGFLLPKPTTLVAVQRFNPGALFRFASLTDRQLVAWTAAVIPIGASVNLGEAIQIPYSIVPLPGLSSCLKWTAEAAVAALTIQLLPL